MRSIPVERLDVTASNAEATLVFASLYSMLQIKRRSCANPERLLSSKVSELLVPSGEVTVEIGFDASNDELGLRLRTDADLNGRRCKHELLLAAHPDGAWQYTTHANQFGPSVGGFSLWSLGEGSAGPALTKTLYLAHGYAAKAVGWDEPQMPLEAHWTTLVDIGFPIRSEPQ